MRFVLIAIALTTGLLLLRPLAIPVVGAVARASVNLVLENVAFAGHGHVRLVVAPPELKAENRQEALWDTFMVLKNDANDVEARRTLSSTRLFYTSTCVFLGLTLALGRGLRQRRVWGAFALGYLALQLAIVGATWLAVVLDFASPGPLLLYDFGESTQALLSTLVQTFHHRLGTAYLLPITIWLAALSLAARASPSDRATPRSLPAKST